jgi:hypothetical protein
MLTSGLLSFSLRYGVVPLLTTVPVVLLASLFHPITLLFVELKIVD